MTQQQESPLPIIRGRGNPPSSGSSSSSSSSSSSTLPQQTPPNDPPANINEGVEEEDLEFVDLEDDNNNSETTNNSTLEPQTTQGTTPPTTVLPPLPPPSPPSPPNPFVNMTEEERQRVYDQLRAAGKSREPNANSSSSNSPPTPSNPTSEPSTTTTTSQPPQSILRNTESTRRTTQGVSFAPQNDTRIADMSLSEFTRLFQPNNNPNVSSPINNPQQHQMPFSFNPSFLNTPQQGTSNNNNPNTNNQINQNNTRRNLTGGMEQELSPIYSITENQNGNQNYQNNGNQTNQTNYQNGHQTNYPSNYQNGTQTNYNNQNGTQTNYNNQNGTQTNNYMNNDRNNQTNAQQVFYPPMTPMIMTPHGYIPQYTFNNTPQQTTLFPQFENRQKRKDLKEDITNFFAYRASGENLANLVQILRDKPWPNSPETAMIVHGYMVEKKNIEEWNPRQEITWNEYLDQISLFIPATPANSTQTWRYDETQRLTTNYLRYKNIRPNTPEVELRLGFHDKVLGASTHVRTEWEKKTHTKDIANLRQNDFINILKEVDISIGLNNEGRQTEPTRVAALNTDTATYRDAQRRVDNGERPYTPYHDDKICNACGDPGHISKACEVTDRARKLAERARVPYIEERGHSHRKCDVCGWGDHGTIICEFLRQARENMNMGHWKIERLMRERAERKQRERESFNGNQFPYPHQAPRGRGGFRGRGRGGRGRGDGYIRGYDDRQDRERERQERESAEREREFRKQLEDQGKQLEELKALLARKND